MSKRDGKNWDGEPIPPNPNHPIEQGYASGGRLPIEYLPTEWVPRGGPAKAAGEAPIDTFALHAELCDWLIVLGVRHFETEIHMGARPITDGVAYARFEIEPGRWDLAVHFDRGTFTLT